MDAMQLWETEGKCRELTEHHDQLLSGEQIRLAYAFSAFADGWVELASFIAELPDVEESRTAVRVPGARGRFEEAEVRLAIHILGTLFAE